MPDGPKNKEHTICKIMPRYFVAKLKNVTAKRPTDYGIFYTKDAVTKPSECTIPVYSTV